MPPRAAILMLAARELGIGSCHASVYDEAMARELLGYPEGFKCDVLISLGYPADPSDLTRPRSHGARRPFKEVAHRERSPHLATFPELTQRGTRSG